VSSFETKNKYPQLFSQKRRKKSSPLWSNFARRHAMCKPPFSKRKAEVQWYTEQNSEKPSAHEEKQMLVSFEKRKGEKKSWNLFAFANLPDCGYFFHTRKSYFPSPFIEIPRKLSIASTCKPPNCSKTVRLSVSGGNIQTPCKRKINLEKPKVFSWSELWYNLSGKTGSHKPSDIVKFLNLLHRELGAKA